MTISIKKEKRKKLVRLVSSSKSKKITRVGSFSSLLSMASSSKKSAAEAKSSGKRKKSEDDLEQANLLGCCKKKKRSWLAESLPMLAAQKLENLQIFGQIIASYRPSRLKYCKDHIVWNKDYLLGKEDETPSNFVETIFDERSQKEDLMKLPMKKKKALMELQVLLRYCIDHNVWYEDQLGRENRLIDEELEEGFGETHDFAEEVALRKRHSLFTISPQRNNMSDLCLLQKCWRSLPCSTCCKPRG
ncbi:unnamed protein product [Brassica napus]|nr:unnamed protein product [Brassica napus]